MTKSHVSASEAARIMGVTRQRVHQMLKAGKIPGAVLVDFGKGRRMWVMPKGSIKPKDQT